MSKPFVVQSLAVGPFKVSVMTGDAEDFIRYKFEEEYPGELCPNILVYVRGRFRRFNEADPTDGVDLSPGDTNDKVGFRRKGMWRLVGLDDNSLHFCFREKGGLVRPIRTEIAMKAAAQQAFTVGQAVLVSAGEVTVNGAVFGQGEIIAVMSASAIGVAGAAGATVHVFSLPS